MFMYNKLFINMCLEVTILGNVADRMPRSLQLAKETSVIKVLVATSYSKLYYTQSGALDKMAEVAMLPTQLNSTDPTGEE